MVYGSRGYEFTVAGRHGSKAASGGMCGSRRKKLRAHGFKYSLEAVSEQEMASGLSFQSSPLTTHFLLTLSKQHHQLRVKGSNTWSGPMGNILTQMTRMLYHHAASQLPNLMLLGW